jgi:glyoxylase-like metal-dependent hydrolase (beta-lactamase superfamily II)
MRIPLEDNYSDIVGKASRGLKIPVASLPAATDAAALRQLALQLRLNPAALVASARQQWYPADPGSMDGLVCFNTPFKDMTVNCYVVFDPATKTAAAFDTGADCSGLLRLPVRIQQIFITHIHGDHILELDRLRSATGATAYVSEREPLAKAESFADRRQFAIGHLPVETRRTSGHSRGGVTYVVTGLAKRLAIVGDALFAGSMGGGLVDYEEALRTNRENILTLPDDTVICPGHGPLTTVGEEKRHNPFFAN